MADTPEVAHLKRALAETEKAGEDIRNKNIKLLDSLAAAEREADRLRHGVPVEGDFVCPGELAAYNLRIALEGLLTAYSIDRVNPPPHWREVVEALVIVHTDTASLFVTKTLAMRETIQHCAALTWAATGDQAAAQAWEKEAVDVLSR